MGDLYCQLLSDNVSIEKDTIKKSMEEFIMSTFEKIQELICDQLDLDKEEVTPETKFQPDLDADSLDLFQIINDIEDEFDVTIDEDELNMETVQDLVDFVDNNK